MKLLRLKITDPNGFRSLQYGFEYHFRTEWDRASEEEFAPFICAGPNGSGKSNLLEVLAMIFFYLDCKVLDYRPDNFEYDEVSVPNGYREEIGIPDAFELEFLGKPFLGFAMPLDAKEHYPHVKVIKKVGEGPKLYILNGIGFSEDDPFSKGLIKSILPDFVLGYSSGENEILSLPFFKMRFIHFDEYSDAIRKGTHYSGTPEGRLTFLDQDFNQAILLSNFILGEEKHLEPFKTEIGLEGVRYFRIIIRDILCPSGLAASSDFETSNYITSKSDVPSTTPEHTTIPQDFKKVDIEAGHVTC